MRLFTGILVASIAVIGPIAAAQSPDTRPMPDLTNHRSWKLVNATRYFVPDRVSILCDSALAARQNPGPHRDKYISVYVNPVGQKQILAQKPGAYPIGTVIVKEKFSDKQGGTPELSTVMVKRERGFNPSSGDWEYAVLDGKSTLVERGRIATCQSCHASRKNQDFVFRTYRPGAPANPWKEGSLVPAISN
jgi:hypothetical protein